MIPRIQKTFNLSIVSLNICNLRVYGNNCNQDQQYLAESRQSQPFFHCLPVVIASRSQGQQSIPTNSMGNNPNTNYIVHLYGTTHYLNKQNQLLNPFLLFAWLGQPHLDGSNSPSYLSGHITGFFLTGTLLALLRSGKRLCTITGSLSGVLCSPLHPFLLPTYRL